MAWTTENRRTATIERRPEPYLTDEMRNELSTRYFPRYPTKRAVLLPALHAIQHTYGWIPPQAMEEIGAFLELAPAEVMDTATFYEEYWLKPKGKYLVQVCRSLSCEICGHETLTDAVRRKCGVEVGETTADGRVTLVELECLGACGTAPVALINDVLLENLTPEQLTDAIDRLPEDPHDYRDPEVTWDDHGGHGNGQGHHGEASQQAQQPQQQQPQQQQQQQQQRLTGGDDVVAAEPGLISEEPPAVAAAEAAPIALDPVPTSAEPAAPEPVQSADAGGALEATTEPPPAQAGEPPAAPPSKPPGKSPGGPKKKRGGGGGGGGGGGRRR